LFPGCFARCNQTKPEKERNGNYKIRKWITIQYKSVHLFWSPGREELRSRRREAWAKGAGGELAWIRGDLERKTEVERSGVTPVAGERRSGGVAPSAAASLSGEGERERERAGNSFPMSSLADRSPGDGGGKAGLQLPLRQPNGVVGLPGAVGPVVSSPRELTRNRSGKASTKQALTRPMTSNSVKKQEINRFDGKRKKSGKNLPAARPLTAPASPCRRWLRVVDC
jgi:hypothetical protein